MKLNKILDKQKMLRCSDEYIVKNEENIFSYFADFNFKIKEDYFYIGMSKSSKLYFLSLEDFFPTALFNSLEDACRDEDYNYIVSNIEPILLDNDSFIENLRNIELPVKISVQYVYLIYHLGLDRFFMGELSNGDYFSLAILDIGQSYRYHVIRP